MGGGTADDSTQAQYHVILAGICHLLGNQRDFKCARNPCNLDILITYAMTYQCILCAGNQLAYNKFIETGSNNADLQTSTYYISF